MLNTTRRYLTSFLLATVLAHTIGARPLQTSSSSADYQLTVTGEVEKSLKLGPSDLAKLPNRSVKATDHGGTESTFEGVALSDILQLAGVKFGDGLRGKSLALYLVVEAADDYRAVFALPELDPSYNDRVVLLANRRNGAKLSEKEGPLRIVVPGDKRQARWVRQVRSLVIRRAS